MTDFDYGVPVATLDLSMNDMVEVLSQVSYEQIINVLRALHDYESDSVFTDMLIAFGDELRGESVEEVVVQPFLTPQEVKLVELFRQYSKIFPSFPQPKL
jgi:hypothetical protein